MFYYVINEESDTAITENTPDEKGLAKKDAGVGVHASRAELEA